ncbi:hypothetical protein [Pedobacter miscanthi]|uniref:hypothetical protein n=1 Tax=Pedobacter miscanthi TaxID=2259170 RepID=UPI00292E9AC4|nr:hypothetical protein [Pedobacter miscanthi]
MNWSTDPEPTNGKGNTTAIEVTDIPKVSGQPATQDSVSSIPNSEITEILACHGAKCTCIKLSILLPNH